MYNLPHSMCLCFMYINDLPTLYLFYTILKKEARYQPLVDCTYWPVMGSYNNLNIIHLKPKSTPFEDFDEIHQIFIDGISDNMASLVQSGKYCVINTSDTTNNRYYVIKFIPEAYTLQNNTTIEGQIITTG